MTSADKIDLLGEATNGGEMLKAADFTWLKENGVPVQSFAQVAARAPVRIIQARRQDFGAYQPAISGLRCLQVAIMRTVEIAPFGDDPEGVRESYPVEIDQIVDLLAISTQRPTTHWRRTCRAWALGTELVFQDRPVDLVEDPVTWLATGGNALCVLDWQNPQITLLREALQLRPQTKFLSLTLRTALSRAAGGIDIVEPD